jgi:UDPglucose 6-dehydrogenase
MEEARRALSTYDDADYANSADQALEGADALLLITEWKEFKSPDFQLIRAKLRPPLITDGRNLYEPALLAALGIDYEGIGGLHRTKKGRTWHCDCSVAFSR